MFQIAVRLDIDRFPYAEHLIHRTLNDHMVRSKSELVIANLLYQMRIPYQYEQELNGINERGKVWPDFSFNTSDGNLIIWEHLGLLTRNDYKTSWDRKRDWYQKNGFVEGNNLFTTKDKEDGGLDSEQVKQVAQEIKKLLTMKHEE